MLPLLAIFIAGVMLGSQGPTNTALARTVGSLQASVVSFIVGTTALGLLVALFGTGNLFDITRVPPWMLCGGFYAALIVVSNVIAMPLMGATLTLMVYMLGQLVMGLAIDAFGWFGAAAVPFSVARIIAVICVLCGIVLAYVGNKKSEQTQSVKTQGIETKYQDGRSIKVLFVALLVFVAGGGSAIQASTNATLGLYIGSIEACFVNFALGLLIVLVLALIVQKGKIRSFKGTRPWQYTGGLFGVVYVIAVVTSTPLLGVGITMAAIMLGQIVAGVATDTFGLFQMQRKGAHVLRLVGAFAVAVGIVLFRLG